MSRALIARWSKMEREYDRRLKVAADALRRAQAAIWDAHYGKGIAVPYARGVDREITKALRDIESDMRAR